MWNLKVWNYLDLFYLFFFFPSAKSVCKIADSDICRISAFGSEFWKLCFIKV